jgi:hypothetical protein
VCYISVDGSSPSSDSSPDLQPATKKNKMPSSNATTPRGGGGVIDLCDDDDDAVPSAEVGQCKLNPVDP